MMKEPPWDTASHGLYRLICMEIEIIDYITCIVNGLGVIWVVCNVRQAQIGLLPT